MFTRSLPAPTWRHAVVVLAVVLLCAASAPPVSSQAGAPVTNAADDTIPIPIPADGITGGSGSEDDPWLVDLDELVRQGLVALEPATPADSVVVLPADVDTIVVAAPRVRVSEVVRRIGQRTQQDWATMAGATWTTLMEVETYNHDDDPQRREKTVETTLVRTSVAADGERREVLLRRVVDRYRGGKPVSSKIDSSASEQWEWSDETVGQTIDAPFALLTANRFRYRIVERTLIGEHLIYRIAFTPRDHFQPGLRGEAWIDYSDFAIRRMRGSITGVSPYPLMIKEIPWFTLRQQEIDGRWLPADFSAEVVLRKLPLLPDRIVFRVSYRDIVLQQGAVATAAGDGEATP